MSDHAASWASAQASSAPPGRTLWRLLPLVVLAIVLAAALRWGGELLGLYSTFVGLVLMVAAAVTIVAAAFAAAGQRLDGAHAQLARSEERFRRMLDSAPDPTVLVDREGKIVLVSVQSSRLFGYAPDELVGQRIEMLVPVDLRAQHAQHRAEYWRDPQARPMGSGLELSALRKDGVELPVEISLSPLAGNDEEVVIASVRDISERLERDRMRRAMEESLAEAQRLESLGVLAGGIAHDFNNLLVGILGNASIALDLLPHEAPARERIADLEVAAQRAAGLVQQMLAYSGKGRFVIEQTRLVSLVAEMAQMLESAISARATLRLDLAPGTPEVKGDLSQLRQVVMNLIVNASEALGDEPGDIVVSTRQVVLEEEDERGLPPGIYAALTVSDTGSGMPPDVQERMFEPFFSTKPAGHGLGLAAVQGIVRGHNGTLELNSEPGQGTVITVLLPAAVAATPNRDVASPSVTWRASGRALVIDDEDIVRRVAARMLARLGFSVDEASSGEEALQLVAAAEEPFAFILLDVTMPGMSGADVLEQLAAAGRQSSVVLSSGYNATEIAQEFAERGVGGFLPKPFTLPQLERVARQAMQRRNDE